MDTDLRITEYISSQRTECSETQKRIINLGKELVNELGLDPGVDTFARWMAHYIAEKMVLAESVVGAEKIKAEQDCFETILKLWQHRVSLPNGNRPFESFEPIFRVLEKLDPANEDPFFFIYDDDARTSETNLTIPQDLQQWLDVALGIDKVARIWIEYVLKQASLCATDERTINWLKASIRLQETDETSVVVRLIPEYLSSDDVDIEENVKQEKRREILLRIERLHEFNDFNQRIIELLNEELEELCATNMKEP